MSNNSKHTETIIQYLDGELAGEDLKSFEKLLLEDNAVQEELNNLLLAKKAIASYGLKAQVASVHREMMKEFEAEKSSPSAKIYPFMRTILKVAASLLVFFLLIGGYQYATVSPAKLYDENYHPYTVSVSRGGAGTTELEKAYADGKPKLVIQLFGKMDTVNNKVKFLAAQSYLSTHQAEKAITIFNSILKSSSSNVSYKEDSEYYLALSYLENDAPAPARVLFGKIYDDKDHLYYDRVSYWTLLKLKLLALKRPGKNNSIQHNPTLPTPANVGVITNIPCF